MREQRVVEPSQRAERGRGADIGVVAVLLELLRLGESVVLREVSLVRNVADDQEPPHVRLQLGLRRSHKDVAQVLPVDERIARITASDVELEMIAGVLAHGEDELELIAGLGVEIGLLKGFLDRLAAPEDLSFLIRRAHDIRGRAAGNSHGYKKAGGDKQSPTRGKAQKHGAN